MMLSQVTRLCAEYYRLQKTGHTTEMTDQEIFEFTAKGLCSLSDNDNAGYLTCAFCTVKRAGQDRRSIRFNTCDSIRDHFSIWPHKFDSLS